MTLLTWVVCTYGPTSWLDFGIFLTTESTTESSIISADKNSADVDLCICYCNTSIAIRAAVRGTV